MSGIFISYRREDSAGWTGRLSEQLKSRFGSKYIFIDIDTIAPGVDFTDALQKAVSSCNVLLAVIGPKWATATDKSGKLRIEDPNDWVRVEIAAALKRNIQVIPVLVGGATIPTMDFLPDELDPLAHRQAHEVTDKRWNFDVEQLIRTLQPRFKKWWPLRRDELWQSTPVMIGALAMAAMLVVWISTTIYRLAPLSATSLSPRPADYSGTQPQPKQPLALKPGAPPGPVPFRIGEDVRLKDSRTAWAYRVLGVEVDPAWKDTVSLKVMVRATNKGPLTAGFGNNNFSLLADDTQRASTSNLHESVDPHSAKEGVVAFTVPTNAERLMLRLRVGDEVAEMPIDVTHPSPLPETTLPPAQTAHLDKVKFPVELRAGQETHLKDHRAMCVYKVVTAQLTRARQDALLLRVTVSVASEGPLATDLDDQNFRLLIDDVPRAPITHLHDSVDPHRVKEGTVEFDVPITAKQLVLQLRVEEQASEFPLDLSPLWS
ncbi:MAG: toll/interleukin-1 receptor domain-containing protein [Nitrospira sp.]|nr:toll/interleukin-1 receptor domain-containing protein [Nitrospira sp.]MDR4470713.1 toll/interleukin-1 receptor domain-containing protein [Nitrospira sp.]